MAEIKHDPHCASHPPMKKPAPAAADLAKRLWKLRSSLMWDTNEQQAVANEAADLIEAQVREIAGLRTERDEWKADSAAKGAVLSSGVVVPADEYAVLVARDRE